MTSGAEDETYEAVITLLDEHCDFGDTNSEIKQKFMLATNSNKLRRYCFRNPDITSENLLTYAKTLENADSQAEEIEKMSKDVEDVNFTIKSKKQSKADEGAKEIGKGGYFGRKSSQDSTQKTCLGVAVVIFIRHSVQR